MRKLYLLFFIFALCLGITSFALADDEADEWQKHLDVYNSDGLDKPVSAIEYKKTMDELNKLKEQKKKKKSWFKRNEMPDEPMTTSEPVKIERNDILKITTPLYYDGTTIPVGFYKIACEEIEKEYFLKFVQGKSTILTIKANKTSHMNFCKDKVNCLETEIYQDKYFKINFKTIDYAVTGYLAIVK